MNKFFLGLIVGLGFIFSQTATAQYDNAVKIGTNGLSYERAITEKSSVQLSGTVSGLFGNPLGRFDDPTISFDNGTRDVTIAMDDINNSGFGLELQYRFYTAKDKNQLTGFYVAPYVSYNRTRLKDINGTDNLGQGFTYSAEFDANRLSFGALIGTQWLVGEKERFVIDVNWFGIGASSWNFGGNYTSSDTSIDFEQQKIDIEEALEDPDDNVPFFSLDQDRYDVVASDNGLDIDFKFLLPRVRLGVSIGWAF